MLLVLHIKKKHGSKIDPIYSTALLLSTMINRILTHSLFRFVALYLIGICSSDYTEFLVSWNCEPSSAGDKIKQVMQFSSVLLMPQYKGFSMTVGSDICLLYEPTSGPFKEMPFLTTRSQTKPLGRYTPSTCTLSCTTQGLCM